MKKDNKKYTGKLYKIISKENKSINGGEYDWTTNLPKKDKKGKWTKNINKPSICNKGYHLTKHWNMWIKKETDKVYECEAKGIIEWEYDKCVCKKVRLIKKIKLDFKDKKMNTGDRNTGYRNTGYKNTGNRNTGDWNTGNKNTGNKNTGDWNTGNRNTGYNNTGNRNTGNRNTGDWNIGDRNTGNSNTGDWNTGNRNTGCFNTKEPEYYELFNKQITKEEYNKISFPNYFYFNLEENKNYKECWKQSFKKATLQEIKETINLPNFDYEIFKEITSITKNMINKKLKEIERNE